MEHSHLVDNAIKYIVGEMEQGAEKDFTKLCDEAGARFNLSPIEADSLCRLFKDEYLDKQKQST